MGKKSKKCNYRCSLCGEGVKTEDELIQHVQKEHPDNGDILFEMIGRFATIEDATKEYKGMKQLYLAVNDQNRTLQKQLRDYQVENERLVQIANAYRDHVNTTSSSLGLLDKVLTQLNPSVD
jgi:hypothetical protein